MASDPDRPDDAAPVLGTWGAWYALVLGVLAALVVVFTLIGREYR